MVQAPYGGYNPKPGPKPWMGPMYSNYASNPNYKLGQGGPKLSSASQQAWYEELNGADRNAAAALIELFQQWDLGSLASEIIRLVQDGYGADAIMLRLQETDSWKQRFIGNEARKRAGLPVLNPQEYLATERAYRQVFQQYGIPKGFYDSASDFADLIGRDWSPQELQSRMEVVNRWVTGQTPEASRALRDLYGVGAGIGEAMAYAIDPNRALPLLQKQAQAVGIASAAYRQGLGQTREYAERLAALGITEEQANAGYGAIGEALPTYEELGEIYNISYSQRDMERDVFENLGEAKQKRKTLQSQERAAFGGSSRGHTGRAASDYRY